MNDLPIFPRDLMAMLGIKHANTLRTHIKAGKVPPPDVRLTQKTRYWWRSTLVRAGLVASANPPTPAASSADPA
jgi:hypothetical protein